MLECGRRILPGLTPPKYAHWMALAALTAWGALPWAQAIPTPPDLTQKRSTQVRVRLTEAAEVVPLRGFDLKFRDRAIAGSERVLARSDRIAEWDLRCRLGWVHAVNRQNHKKVSVHGSLTVETPAGFFQFRGRPYREELVIHPDQTTCEVVNHVDLEKYLDGLVNAEFSAKWSEEAIASQVVAARTYAIFQIREARRRKNSRFDLDSTIKDQVYDGSMKEDYRASLAVEKTRGMVLTATDHGSVVPLKAFYHSTCGGTTDLPERVWGDHFPGFGHKVRCPYCATSPRYSWELEVTPEQLVQAFAQGRGSKGWPSDWLRWITQGKLLGLSVEKTDEEGRALRVLTRWSLGPRTLVLQVSGAQFRTWVGSSKLRSTWFTVRGKVSQGRMVYLVRGRGNGHGVGLCQWGAKVMGERGFKMASILKFYYPDAILKKLW